MLPAQTPTETRKRHIHCNFTTKMKTVEGRKEGRKGGGEGKRQVSLHQGERQTNMTKTTFLYEVVNKNYLFKAFNDPNRNVFDNFS